ncbi:hypothetical protein H4W23_01215 [Streptomyces gardneri]|uniref:hypothetical protein n=1 Tax=Streptomyces gardneri TaxID=66892 RepID=UPI0006BDD002|nr:hypothetical protein [Streptomyces gardneri]QPK43386.1 hypothetical protein H4W23_01215 [Streptomyces gardneri]WRK34610.1 hypothetical protein U0M97_01210 [Streptomyces venezuelae]CUM43930.1 hypothetical protein BN2537_16825 [Streptomyces venezuelae]
MNGWLLAAGITALGVAAVHIVGGRRDVVRPLLSCGLADEPKRVLHAVWHMVSIDLVLSGLALLYLSLTDGTPGTGLVAWFVAAHFMAYAAAFLVVTLSVGWPRPLLRLPQWILLLPVAALAAAGAA